MKYRFEVIYQNKYMKQSNEFLKTCDINIGDIGIKEVFTFTTNTPKSIQEIKEDIKRCFDLCEMELLNIEGGKVE